MLGHLLRTQSAPSQQIMLQKDSLDLVERLGGWLKIRQLRCLLDFISIFVENFLLPIELQIISDNIDKCGILQCLQLRLAVYQMVFQK